MRNKIESTVKAIAIKNGNPDLVDEIYRDINFQLSLKPNRLWRWKTNKNQPSILDAAKILDVLKQYDDSVSMEDLFEREKAVADKKIDKIFN